MKKIASRAFLVLWGGAWLWAPLIAVEFAMVHLLTGSLLPPSTFLLGYYMTPRRIQHGVRSVALWMLIGGYLLAPWFILAGATAHGAGFSQMHGWKDWRWPFVQMFFPPMTFVMAVYDFSALGLLATTVIAVGLHYREKRRARPVIGGSEAF